MQKNNNVGTTEKLFVRDLFTHNIYQESIRLPKMIHCTLILLLLFPSEYERPTIYLLETNCRNINQLWFEEKKYMREPLFPIHLNP